MKDAIKGYFSLATGLTEVTRQRATAAAKALVAQGEATAGQVQALADDLVAQSRSNREAAAALVRYEVDKALGRVGLVSKDEVDALQARIKTLEAQLRGTAAQAEPGRGTTAGTNRATASTASVTKPTAKKPTAQKPAAQKPTATKPAAKQAPSSKTAASKGAAEAPAPKTPAAAKRTSPGA